MKKMMIFFLTVLLFLPSCQKSTILSAGEIAAKIKENTQNATELVCADEDFVALNFPDAPIPAESAVYISGTSPATEFGVFSMNNSQDASYMLLAVRQYLSLEYESKVSLARLYPGDMADADAERYAHAVSGSKENFVYYFVGEEAEAAAARSAFEGMTKNQVLSAS